MPRRSRIGKTCSAVARPAREMQFPCIVAGVTPALSVQACRPRHPKTFCLPTNSFKLFAEASLRTEAHTEVMDDVIGMSVDQRTHHQRSFWARLGFEVRMESAWLEPQVDR